MLDEGHIIRNPDTKVAAAAKALTADFRLILTGTPVQNHLLDLWSLFDFLMPGYLGCKRAFKSSVASVVQASRARCVALAVAFV